MPLDADFVLDPEAQKIVFEWLSEGDYVPIRNYPRMIPNAWDTTLDDIVNKGKEHDKGWRWTTHDVLFVRRDSPFRQKFAELGQTTKY